MKATSEYTNESQAHRDALRREFPQHAHRKEMQEHQAAQIGLQSR